MVLILRFIEYDEKDYPDSQTVYERYLDRIELRVFRMLFR